jgi:mRNA-degrading endonuclease toxin of MazEF toxin-antitoxin module
MTTTTTTTTATASADVPNNSRGSTERRWKHRSTHFTSRAGLLLAMTIATINVSTIALERMVDLDEVASNMPRATAIAVETIETMHTTDNQKTHFTLPKEMLERQKQKIIAKLAAIEKFKTFLERKTKGRCSFATAQGTTHLRSKER